MRVPLLVHRRSERASDLLVHAQRFAVSRCAVQQVADEQVNVADLCLGPHPCHGRPGLAMNDEKTRSCPPPAGWAGGGRGQEVCLRSAADPGLLLRRLRPAVVAGAQALPVQRPLDSGPESASDETSLVDESRVELGVCGDEGVQDELLAASSWPARCGGCAPRPGPVARGQAPDEAGGDQQDDVGAWGYEV